MVAVQFTYKAVGASYTMDQLMVIEAKAKSFFGRHNGSWLSHALIF